MRFNLFAQSDVPAKYRTNFKNLYFDIAWYGVLSGTSINFLNIYAARLGSSALQIGLLTAASAVINLFLAIPAAHWLVKQNTGKAVFWSSVLYRFGYFLWIPLPWLFDAQTQIWALIGITFFMAIPLTPLGVGFNALFAEAVPERFRAHVAGIRNFTFAIAYMLTSFGVGYMLDTLPIQTGYSIMFGIGAFGAAMSSFHLYRIRPIHDDSTPLLSAPEQTPVQKVGSPSGISSLLRLDILRSNFKSVLLALFLLHLSHQVTTPIYPLYNVNVLHLNDDHIGIGTALYYLTMLIASTQLFRVVHRLGNKRTTAWGLMGMSLYPITLALSQQVWHYYLLSLFGGFLWAFVNGSYANYLLEKIPPTDRPAHLAWYNIVLNLALLGSSLIGPAIAEVIGLAAALIVFGISRVIAGIVILKKG